MLNVTRRCQFWVLSAWCSWLCNTGLATFSHQWYGCYSGKQWNSSEITSQSLELATLTIPFYCSAPNKDCIITGAFFRQDIFPTWPCRQRDIVNDSVHLVAFKMVVLCLFRYRCVHTDAFMCVRVFLCMCAVYLNITPWVCVTASWLHAAESIRYFQIVFKKAPLRCNPAMQGTQ